MISNQGDLFSAVDRPLKDVFSMPGHIGKAARGKTLTDVWRHIIASPNGKVKTAYATQKPLGILEHPVKVHSKSGDLLLDFFAGSGTLGESGSSPIDWGRSRA